MDRNAIILRKTTLAVEPIYTSVVRKLERRAVRRHTLPRVPYIDERDSPLWRNIRGLHGFSVLKLVLESAFATRGWKISVTANDSNYLYNGKHMNLRIVFKGLGITFPITAELPVLEAPLWCPRRYGGIWTVFELHEGRAWAGIQKLITEIDRRLYFKLPDEIMQRTVGSPTYGPLVLPTPHVCHLCRVPYDGNLTDVLRAQKGEVRYD